MPGDGKNPEQWKPVDKFAVVLEAAALNEAELAEYGRKKGLFVEQIDAWKQAFIRGNADTKDQKQSQVTERRKDKKHIQQLERELRRKDKALAETAALLVLAKKARAIWGEPEDD